LCRPERAICIFAQVNVDKQARKLEEVKAQPHAPGPQGKAAKAKKVEKLERSIKMQMAKELNSVKLKQALVVCSTLQHELLQLETLNPISNIRNDLRPEAVSPIWCAAMSFSSAQPP
jgi:hypothetical protein